MDYSIFVFHSDSGNCRGNGEFHFVFYREIVQERNTTINGGMQAIYWCEIKKIYCHQRCIKIQQDISLHQAEGRRLQMARQMLGDFHINLQSPLSHIPQWQFQQEIVQEIIQQFGPTLVRPSGMYWQSRDLSRSFGTSSISLTLSLYMECNAHSFFICKGVGSKQHMPLTRPFQGNHVKTNECVQHWQNEASPGWDGNSGGQSRDWEWNQWRPGSRIKDIMIDKEHADYYEMND